MSSFCFKMSLGVSCLKVKTTLRTLDHTDSSSGQDPVKTRFSPTVLLKSQGPGNMELLSVRRSGGNWRSTGMCADLHCTTTALHTHTMCKSCTVHTTAPLSHSTLVAAFHQNFTPILTITQLVTVRSNHSESENHDRLLLIKLLESVADCEKPRVKFE